MAAAAVAAVAAVEAAAVEAAAEGVAEAEAAVEVVVVEAAEAAPARNHRMLNIRFCRVRVAVPDRAVGYAEWRIVTMRGPAGGHIAIIELQVDLRSYRPDDAGDELIGKGGGALTVAFRRILIVGQHASCACTGAHGKGELGRYGNVVSNDSHDGANGDMATSPVDPHTSRRRCRGDLVTGVAIFELKAEAGGPFVSGSNIEARSIVELNFATRRGL